MAKSELDYDVLEPLPCLACSRRVSGCWHKCQDYLRWLRA